MEDSVPLVNAMPSKISPCFCQSSTSAIGGGCHWSGWPSGVSQITTIRSAPRYGNGLYRSAFITLKMVLFTPIPKARDATTMQTKPGFLRRLRAAYLRSLIKVCQKKEFPIFAPQSDRPAPRVPWFLQPRPIRRGFGCRDGLARGQLSRQPTYQDLIRLVCFC